MSALYPDTVTVLEQYGPVAPTTATQPLRYPPVKYGDGVFVEEGTTNLITNPSFETNTTGWTGAGTAPTLTRSTARSFVGSASLLVTWPAAAAQASVVLWNNLAATISQTYTISVWVYVPTGSPAVSLGYYDGANHILATSTLFDRWQRLTGTFTAGFTGTHGVGIYNAATATAGQSCYVDAVQAENKTYSTSFCDGSLGSGYAWTGTAHASTSTRAAGRLKLPLSLTPTTWTLAAWFKPATTGPSFRIPVQVSDANVNWFDIYYAVSSGNWFGRKVVAGVGIEAIVNAIIAVGDLVFVATTFDGAAVKLYVSLNGGAVSSASTASTTVPSTLSQVDIGTDYTGGNCANAAIEQVLTYNAALSSTEIAALAAGGPIGYADDSRIVFAAATAWLKDSTSAHTATGTGFYRDKRNVAARHDYARRLVAVPTGSGIGVGTPIRVRYGTTNTVTSVVTTGVDEELTYS